MSMNSLLPPIISGAIVDLYIMLTSLHMECHKIQHTVFRLARIAVRKAGAGFENLTYALQISILHC